MKVILVISIVFLFRPFAEGQVLGGFFDQQDTKDKTMLQQIALQQTYLSALKKGYSNAKTGLNTAHDLKNGTFSLHQAYFNSLGQVSPAIKNNPKIGLITELQQQIINCFEQAISWQKQQAILDADEISYQEKVYDNMLTACTRDLDELNMVVTPGDAQMKDAERINRIDHIYGLTNDKYKFTMSFTRNAQAYALVRRSNGQQSQVIKKLYNIN